MTDRQAAPTSWRKRLGALCAILQLSGCGPAQPKAQPTPTAQVQETPPPRRDILGKKKKHYSQHDEEVIIRDFFQDRREGVFLDVGCAWPKKDSNTYFLESELDWTGIGIDALPQYARAWGHQRPRSHFFNYLVTDHVGPAEKFFRPDRADLSGLSSATPLKKSSSGHKVPYKQIRVPTTTLTKLLDENHVSRVDLMSLDIEGHELLALAGFDVERFRPELVCVEWFHAGREKLRSYFAAHGYERIERYLPYDTVNDYYTPKSLGRAPSPTS
jgi:FkbM family methyltransferase